MALQDEGIKLLSTLRNIGSTLGALAARSRISSMIYLEGLGALSRALGQVTLTRRLLASVRRQSWPEVKLRFRRVQVGSVSFKMRPHVWEFDLEALFSTKMTYEASVFSVLDPRMSSYRVVVEIGANVGLYTLYFAARALERPLYVIAFEPSREAFRRLQENLRENSYTAETFNVAVSSRAALCELFEPRNHLTNGSLHREFAEVFSDDIVVRHVPTFPAEALEALLCLGPALIKIDIEGAEPEVLRAMMPLLCRFEPDIVVEVLPKTEQPLNELSWPERYRFFEITKTGLEERASFGATKNRDYIRDGSGGRARGPRISEGIGPSRVGCRPATKA